MKVGGAVAPTHTSEVHSVATNKSKSLIPCKYDEVIRLFAEEMKQLGYAGEQIENGKHLWKDFFHKRRPRVAKPGVYAAAVEYTIARLDFLEDVTQVDVARRYGVSVSSVTRVFAEVMRLLQIDLFDERYCTMDSPFGDLLETDDGLLVPTRLLDDGSDLELWAPPLAAAPEVIEKVLQLPATGEVWGGCRESLRAYMVHPIPFRPDVVLWVDESLEMIINQRVLLPDEDDSALLEVLLDGMLTPAVGRPRRPELVTIDDRWYAVRLAEALEPMGISVEVEPTPVVKGILDYMEQSLNEDLPQHTFFEVEGITTQTLEQFFHSSARLLRAAPWSAVLPLQSIAVDLHRWGFDRLCVAVTGLGQQQRGLKIFRSAEDYLAYEELNAIHQGPLVEPCCIMELMTLSFQVGNLLDSNRRKEVFRHGWEVDNASSFPVLTHSDADDLPVPLTTETYKAVCACADGVARFTRGHPEIFASEKPPLTTEVVNLPGWPEEEPVLVTAPHPDLVAFI